MTHTAHPAANHTAFEAIVRTHANLVTSVALSIVHDVALSEDIAQEVFARAWARLDQLRDPKSVPAWLRQMTRNQAIEHLRGAARRGRLAATADRLDARGTPTAEDAMLAAERDQAILSGLEELSADAREVLVLYYREGMDVQQVANLLDLPAATVRKRMSRARAQLRDDVAQRLGDALRRTAPAAAFITSVMAGVTAAPAASASPPAGPTTTSLRWGTGAAVVGATLGLALFGFVGQVGSSPSDAPPSTPGEPLNALVGAADGPDEAEPVPKAAGSVSFGAARPIETSEGHVETPVWSDDGDTLAFEVNPLAGNIELFVLRDVHGATPSLQALKLPGAGSSPYGTSSTVATGAAFHPQGILVFEGSSKAGAHRLYYASEHGRAAQEFINASTVGGGLTFPSLSADGNQLAFVSSATGAGDLYVRNGSTSHVEQLTHTPQTESNPQLSPDGKRIVFSREHAGTQDLFELVIASKEGAAVAGGDGDQTRPVYGKDGVIVYFDGSRGEDTWDLAMVPSAGAPPQTLARDVRLPTRARPALSPDGKWVAYAHSDPTRDADLYLASLDGKTVRAIPTGLKGVGDPAITVKEGRTILAFTALPATAAGWRGLWVIDGSDPL